VLIGGAGRDLLVGVLVSNPTPDADSDPVQSAGTIEAGHHDLALQSLLAEWTAAKDVQGSNRVWRDGSLFHTDPLADDNATRDELTGSSDLDRLFSDRDIFLAR
jgi:hypothetical protein